MLAEGASSDRRTELRERERRRTMERIIFHCDLNSFYASVELLDHPELINQDAYAAWMIQVGDISDKEELLSVSDYEELLSKEA